MERAPTPTAVTNNHEAGDTPIYDQLMKEFMSIPDGEISMTSNTAYSGPESDAPPVQPESSNAIDAINQLDANLSLATSQDNEKSKGRETLELTPEESRARVKLEGIKNLSNAVSERFVTPRQNQIGSVVDQLRNAKDIGARKVLLLDRREQALQRDAARLKTKLAGMNPNGMRYRRLNKKMGMKNIKLGETRTRIGVYASAVQNRSTEREQISRSREVSNEVARDMLIVAKKVAFEKKQRRKLQKEVRRAITPEYRAKMEAQLEERVAKIGPINKLQERLVNDVVRRAERTYKTEG